MLAGFLAINVAATVLTAFTAINPVMVTVLANGILSSLWVSFIIARVELKRPFDREAGMRTLKIGVVFALIAYLWTKGIYL